MPLTDVYPSRGILTIHTTGQQITGLRIHGYVEVRAPDVTISDSAIIGPDHATDARGDRGLLKNTSGAGRNLRVEDTTIAPTWPVPGLDGVHGWDFSLDRVDISGSVDGVKVFGPNVVIQHSWIHDLTTFDHDPDQRNGPSHSDGVQVQGGDTIVISGNTISGGHNSALQVTQDTAATSNLWFDGNWVDAGACTVNISRKHRPVLQGLHVDDNIFGHAMWVQGCALIYNPADSDLRPTGNVWADTRQPVAPSRGD